MGEAYTQKLRARSPGTKTTKIKDWWWVLRKKSKRLKLLKPLDRRDYLFALLGELGPEFRAATVFVTKSCSFQPCFL